MFSLALFLDGVQALIVVSLLIGYPHLFFTAYYLKKTNISLLLPLLIAVVFASVIQTNITQVMLIYLYLQPLHYNYQNWVVISPEKKFNSFVYWLLITGLHYLVAFQKIQGIESSFLSLLGLNAAFFVFSYKLLKIEFKTSLLGFLFIFLISIMDSKESMLAMAAGWHGLQYILTIEYDHKLKKEITHFYLLGIALMACLYSVTASFFILNNSNLAIAIALGLNFTHYLFDFIYLGREYFKHDSPGKSYYY